MIPFTLSGAQAFLESILTPARMQHSLGVMQTMGELSGIYGLDRETAMAAGLLHDAAKDLTPAEQAEILAESGYVLADPCEADYSLYLHGPVGAFFVSKKLGVSDPLILEAIIRHTWCGTFTDLGGPLVWCLRFSDILEPYRSWNDPSRIIHANDAALIIRAGLPRLRRTIYAGHLEAGMLLFTDLITRFLEDLGAKVHPNYRTAYQVLSSNPSLAHFVEE